MAGHKLDVPCGRPVVHACEVRGRKKKGIVVVLLGVPTAGWQNAPAYSQ